MKNTFIILTLVLLVSCYNKKEQRVLSSSIPVLHGISDTVTASTLFDDFEYISLETTKQSIFGNIDKLIVHNDNFFILDKAILKKIIVFSKSGKYIRTIGNLGKGPGEYSNIEDFTIDKKTDNIIILYYPSTVITYDSKGTFISQKKLSSTALLWNICSYNDGFIFSTNHQSLLTGDDAYLIFNYDSDFTILNKVLKPLPAQVGMPPIVHNTLSKTGGNVAYFDFFTSTLHLNVNTKHIKTVKFDFEGKEVPLDYYANPMSFYSKQREYCFFINNIFIDNTLLATFANQGNQCLLTFDINTNNSTSYKISEWFSEMLYYKDKTIYSSFSPSQIVKGHNFFKASNKTKYPIEAESNPVILSFKMKD